MALLSPQDQRDSPEGLSKALSEYYNSPGRLAIFRRKFDNVSRQDGEDPASFATELEILAVRGFREVGRTQMVRDRFILGQRDCKLRRHLDCVPPDTPIWEIVDRCRVWESHSPTPALEPVALAAVIQEATDSSLSQRKGGQDVSDRPTHRRDSCEVISKLVAALRQSVHQGIPAELDPDTHPVALPGVGALLRHMDLPESTLPDIPSSRIRGTEMVCYSCSRSGHGVCRCSHVDTAFPFLPPGWSVEFRDGQYRAMWPTVQQGNADWSGREVSLPDQ